MRLAARLLEAHLARDPGLLTRTFDITDVFPLAPASWREPSTAQGTPVHRTTLLHIAAYFDEVEIGTWLLDRGMNPDAPAAVDATASVATRRSSRPSSRSATSG